MADALRRAAGNGDLQRVKALLATGVDVNALCPLYGKTPLHDAAWQGRIECLEALLAAGASVDSKTRFGSTPLHYACQMDHVTCAQSLIRAGANPNARNHDGLTPFYNAFGVLRVWGTFLSMERRRRRFLKILMRAGATMKFDTPRERFRGEGEKHSWALVDAVVAAGGWARFATRHRAIQIGLVSKCAHKTTLPDVLKVEIAEFLSPVGGS